jgi:4-azaleucine resistance transporter AzlC
MGHDRSTPFGDGVRSVAPILIGVIPFGLIAGIAAVEAGLEPVQAFALSPVVFAGASQLAMIDLLTRDAAAVVIVATALVINARFAMYSASLAPEFRSLSPVRKAVGGYILTDQSFAVSVVRFGEHAEGLDERFSFYMGASLALWTTWQISSLIGVVVGAGIPESWALDFAIPLVFMALLFPAIRDRGDAVAALTAGAAAVAFFGLPLNLGLLAAAALGLVAGTIGGKT